MTPAEAEERIAKSGLVLAIHADLPQVQAIIDADPALIEAMNALTPKPGDETPQRAAAHCRKLDILQYFIDRGVQPDLFMACSLNLNGLVDAYLNAHPKEVDAKGAHGIPLMVHANQPAMVELLLTHGADPSLALVQLAWSGRVELMQIALAHGAEVDPPKQGRRALHIAAAQGHVAAVELLLNAGADTNVRAHGGEWEFKSALGLAIMHGHTPVADLIRRKAPLKPAPVRRPRR